MQQRIPPDLYRAMMEIMPNPNYIIKKFKKLSEHIYKVYAEDSEYDYSIEISLRPRGDDYFYTLLDFDYQEKKREKEVRCSYGRLALRALQA